MISDVVVQWCTQGDLLAVAGMEKQSQLLDLSNGSLLKSALVKFYNVRGEHIYTLETPVQVGGIFKVSSQCFDDMLFPHQLVGADLQCEKGCKTPLTHSKI